MNTGRLWSREFHYGKIEYALGWQVKSLSRDQTCKSFSFCHYWRLERPRLLRDKTAILCPADMLIQRKENYDFAEFLRFYWLPRKFLSFHWICDALKRRMISIDITWQLWKTDEKRKIGTDFWYRVLSRYADGHSAYRDSGSVAVCSTCCSRNSYLPTTVCENKLLRRFTLRFCAKKPRMNTGRNNRYQKPVPICARHQSENAAF